jgi:uncharacterized membrane protein YgdD (TMEM256/DUF423 family)
MRPEYRQFVILAAILGFLGVGIGAFGAHGLQATLRANGREDTFETANRYHMLHALALIGVAVVGSAHPHRLIRVAGYALFAGAVIFAGSLYILAVFNIAPMGAVAPIGGALMLVGWACLGISMMRSDNRNTS